DRELTYQSGFLGEDVSNNQAEYLALIAGLILARDFIYQGKLEIYTDSSLVVNQVAGRWQLRAPKLVTLCYEVRSRMRGLEESGRISVALHHIRGHQGVAGNERADTLAGVAAESRKWAYPSLISLLKRSEHEGRQASQRLHRTGPG
ncbi:hypothetical protein LCGC14_1865750, partial [marine sediment metagenome]